MADGDYYKISVETLGARVNTGICHLQKGMMTLFVTSGTLNVARFRDNNSRDVFKVHAGDCVVFSADETFSYGTGNETVNVFKTVSSVLEVEFLTESITPEDIVGVKEVFSHGRQVSLSPDRMVNEAPRRRSTDPEYRAHVGQLLAQDKAMAGNKQHLFRGAVPPQAAQQVAPRNGQVFEGVGDLANQSVPAMNPQPIRF